MSWITLTDEVRAIRLCLDHDVHGPVNMVAPNPVTNRDFTKLLAGALHRPAVMTVPSFVLEAKLGREMARELALVSQRIIPTALIASGFAFTAPTLDVAFDQLIGVAGA
jgi:NAD dependent epimerase/dehydratase family enzyme